MLLGCEFVEEDLKFYRRYEGCEGKLAASHVNAWRMAVLTKRRDFWNMRIDEVNMCKVRHSAYTRIFIACSRLFVDMIRGLVG